MASTTLSRQARAVASVAPLASAAVRRLTVEARAVRFHKHGAPANVLRTETVKLDSAAMKPSQVLVRMLASPITYADLAQVFGTSGKAPSFPHVGGNEGVGVVLEAGSAAGGLKKGDVVVASAPGVGTWSTHVVADAASLTKLDGPAPGSKEAKGFVPELAAVAVGAPVLAAALLDAASLKTGDVVVQNNAGSLVGQALIQLAAERGLRTVNITSPVPFGWADLSHHLQGIGGTVVVDEIAAGRTSDFRKLLADLAPAKLGVNGAGGAAAGTVARALGAGATLVTYGGRAVSLPSAAFTTKGLTLKGINPGAAAAGATKEARDKAVAAAVARVADGRTKLLVAREPFADFGVALKRVTSGDAPHRVVVLVMPQQ